MNKLTYSLIFFIISIVGCANMPTSLDRINPTSMRVNAYENGSCDELKSTLNYLQHDESNLIEKQSKRLESSSGHALFYGWGKGDGMDTIELITTKSKIITIREIISKKCIDN